MDGALVRLLMLRLIGGLRLRVRQLASLRGALSLLVVGGAVWLLVDAGMSSPKVDPGFGTSVDPQALDTLVGTFMPLGLLGLALLTVVLTTGHPFHFSPTEINFLFVGPFSRRDLIVYKMCAYLAGVVLSAAMVTPFVMEQTGSAFSAFAATVLTLLFIQLNSAAFGLAWQACDGGRLARMRWLVVALFFTLVLAAGLYAWTMPGYTVFDSLVDFRHSWIGTAVLLPYIVFAELYLAPDLFPHLAGWGTLAILINAALLQAVVILDGRTSDRSLVANSRRSARWDRMRQGGTYWVTERTEMRSLRRAPMLGGMGPMVWRQAINALRNSARVVAVFMAIAACTGPLASAVGLSFADGRTWGFAYFFFVFVLPRTLICDFRGDLNRMETYKTLPIAPWRICLGQLAVQVFLTYVIALTMIASVLFFGDGIFTRTAVVLAAFALPFCLLICTIENTVFLLFPAKLIPMGRADFEFIGRGVVEFVVKSVVILTALAVATGTGLFLFTQIRNTWLLAGMTSWLTLTLIAALTTIAMQYAFRRFTVAETFG